MGDTATYHLIIISGGTHRPHKVYNLHTDNPMIAVDNLLDIYIKDGILYRFMIYPNVIEYLNKKYINKHSIFGDYDCWSELYDNLTVAQCEFIINFIKAKNTNIDDAIKILNYISTKRHSIYTDCHLVELMIPNSKLITYLNGDMLWSDK